MFFRTTTRTPYANSGLERLRVQAYTFDIVRDVFLELFCMPKSSLDNPNLRASAGPRAFCILEQGELCDEYGYWAEDDDTGEVGFPP